MSENPVENFLLQHFNVSDISAVNPYINCSGTGSDVARFVSLQATLTFDANHQVLCLGDTENVELHLTRRARKLLDSINSTHVFPTTFICTHHENSSLITTFLASLTYSPVPYDQEQRNKMIDAAVYQQGVGASSFSIPPNVDEDCRSVAQQPDGHTLEMPFIANIALLNKYNVQNGVLKLPDNVWQPSFPAEETVTELAINEQDSKPEPRFRTYAVSAYFGIPGNHTLAWGLHLSDKERRERGYAAYEARITRPDNSPEILFFFVPGFVYEKLLRSWMLHFNQKCQGINMNQIGLKLIPQQRKNVPVDPNAVIRLNCNIGFVAFPLINDHELARVAPKLSNDFPAIRHFIPEYQPLALDIMKKPATK